MSRIRPIALLTAAVAVLLPAGSVFAAPLVQLTLLGRNTTVNPGGPFSATVQVHSGDTVEYEIVGSLAAIGSSNTNSGVTRVISNLQNTGGKDGLNALKFNLYEAASQQIQVDMANPATLNHAGGWDNNTGASGGTPTARGVYHDLDNMRPIQASGVFVGADVNAPVLIASGTMTVATLGALNDSVVSMSYLQPVTISTSIPATFHINFSNGVNGSPTGSQTVNAFTGNADSMMAFGGLTLQALQSNPVPEPASMLVWGAGAFGGLLWMRKRRSC